MKRNPIFYNVLTGSLSLLNKDDSYFTDPETPNFKKSPRWYTEESNPSFYEPHILVSGPHNRKKDVCSDIKVGKDTTVFGDSGGFQLATGKITAKEWNAKIALEWSEHNANVFPILDLPVAGKTKYIDDAINFSVESAKYYHENRSRTDRKVLNVLSSSRACFMEQWYNSLKEYKFDGWAFGGHSNHLKTILNGIMFLVNKGEFDTSEARPLHVFGTTSMSVIPYIVYAQHLLNERGVNIQLSFDSSCASAEANYGSYIQYCTPTSKVSVAVSNRYDWSLLDNFSKLGCKCPLCRDIDNLEYIFSEEGKGQFYTIIALHNFYQMLSYKRTFEGIVSLNCQEVLDGLPKDLKMNFKAMKKAFSKTGDEGITVIENEIKTRTKKNPLDKSGRSKAICNILGEE